MGGDGVDCGEVLGQRFREPEPELVVNEIYEVADVYKNVCHLCFMVKIVILDEIKIAFCTRYH